MAELLETTAPQEPKGNPLGYAPIGKLLVKFAIPGIVAQVVNSLYNIIDQIFIGNFVGSLGNGATSIVFPISTMVIAIILMIGDGAASFMSLRLGEKREKEAADGVAAGIASLIVVSVVMTAFAIIFMRPLCKMFGSSENILPYAIDYGTVTAIGFPFVAFCAGGSSIIRADGNPKFNMYGLFAGTITNITLDALFIIVLGWGVKGAALATISGQFVNCCMNIWYLKCRVASIDLKFENFRYWWRNLLPVCKLGISSFITQASMVVAMAARNNTLTHYGALSKYGADIPVTTLGITMKFFAIFMCVILGLAAGAQPIFGFNYGAGNYDRVKKTYKTVVIIASIAAVFTFAIAQIFPLQIISIFGKEDALYNEFAVKCMRIYLGLIPLAGFQISTGIFFQATGYPVQASIMSLSKQILFQVPATLILPIFIGVVGCLWAGPVADFLSTALTLILLLAYWKKIFSKPVLNAAPAEAPAEVPSEAD